VGTPALAFADDLDWIQGESRSLAELRGRVVLVRFWTDTCPFCAASAPALEALHDRFSDRGLSVIGLFHPKPRGSVTDLAAIRARAEALGMTFSIASDARWETLERWWLKSGSPGASERDATSVSFLIDRRGVIRWVHPGPEFHPDGPEDHQQCRDDFADAERAIALLLDEPAARES
jgi:peroxiredoxin